MATSADFKQRFQDIHKDIQEMADLVSKAISRCIEALKSRDLKLAHKIIADDTTINKKRFAIEEKCIALMGSELLPSDDLRDVVSVLSIVTELERIGDYAQGIARIVVMIGDEPPLKPLIDIPRMAELTIEMIEKGIEAFRNRDVALAKHVVSMDNVVDALYDQVFRELLTFMMVDPKTINRATRLIWVAHNLERAADRATNICERVVSTVSGRMEDLEASV